MKRSFLFLLGFLFATSLAAQTPSISEKTKDLSKTEGFFDYFFDEANDKMWLQVDDLNTQFLYVNYLAAGVGSNDIGLDRSQQGGERIVYFEKSGPKLPKK